MNLKKVTIYSKISDLGAFLSLSYLLRSDGIAHVLKMIRFYWYEEKRVPAYEWFINTSLTACAPPSILVVPKK